MKVDKRGRYLKEKAVLDVGKRVERVKESLSKMRKIRNETLTALSERLSRYMREQYPDENISATTLRREDSFYREYLTNYLGNTKKESAATEQQKLMLEKVKVRELTKLNNQYKIEISKLLELASQEKRLGVVNRTHGLEMEESTAPYQALLKCLYAFGGRDGIEIAEEGIYDTARLIGKKLILSNDEYPEFFNWYFKKRLK